MNQFHDIHTGITMALLELSEASSRLAFDALKDFSDEIGRLLDALSKNEDDFSLSVFIDFDPLSPLIDKFSLECTKAAERISEINP